MKLFSPKSKAVVGIDIGTHSVKVVELAGTKANPRVIAWGVAPLPVGAFSENAIANAELIADTLSGLLVSSGVKGTTVSVAVSSSHAITKVLGMPTGMGDLEMEEQISIEALHFIPYPIDEVNLDFEVLGPSLSNDSEEDVLLVACRRTIVEDYIDLIESLELSLEYVDIDTYALERVYRSQNNLGSHSDEPVAIFDIGSSSSHLMVVDGERVLYSRHQNFGAAQLVKLIRKEYGVSAEEAEEILNSSQPPADFLSAVQEPYVEMLRQEISRALQFFYSSSSHSNIDSVVLTGASCALAGLGGDLELKLRSKVVVLNPFTNANVQSRRDAVLAKAPALAMAYGLSLRGLN
ncbi:type IV pilus assembly protein PilM [Arenicella sp. 4NH20-0111]|uniref:type IV pilus assembly protein PilM n=1 Tax=Arenicella sp. 4NH20-0111 TaxID=3127648 RepID=UPI003109BB96